jgi:predicted nucleic acid-binding Zn ribbon protein
MDLDSQLKLGHLFFTERKCRSCGNKKSLIEDFYRIRKGVSLSSYSYECKECTKKRVVSNRKLKNNCNQWQYPDW